jgi:hypothetical protein
VVEGIPDGLDGQAGIEQQRRLVAVLVEVEDVELAAGFDVRSGVDLEFDAGAVTQIQESESPVTIDTNVAPVFPRGRGFHRRVGDRASDELGMGGALLTSLAR